MRDQQKSRLSFFFLNQLILFIYIWLLWVFIAACELSLFVTSGGYSFLQGVGFSLQWLLLLQSMGSRYTTFSSCGTWAQQLWLASSRIQAQQLWSTGLVTPRHVGSSLTKDQTHVPCIGRRILFFFFFNIYLFGCTGSYLLIYFYIYFWLCWVFVSVRGLSPVVASGGHSSSRCAGLFTIAASLVAEHRLQTHRLSSCGSRAQLLRGMWDHPRPGLEPVSPALAGRFSTTAQPGKPGRRILNHCTTREVQADSPLIFMVYR